MSITDDLLKANVRYAEDFRLGHLKMPPARKLAVVACMDARVTVERLLGLETGDAHIIRNAGGIITEDALRSLVISQQLLGTEEVVIINHTDCGMLTFDDRELRERLERRTGTSPVVPLHFHAFTDLDENVRRQIARVRQHPWIPGTIPVRGFVYDVATGRLREVPAGERSTTRAA
ncbi:MAG TPA: carbonic anhydrase [Polyangia bacterium]|jgi:carbonic anhydrase